MPMLSPVAGGGIRDVKWKEEFARAYFYWTPLSAFTYSMGFHHERLLRDPEANNPAGLVDSTIHRLPVELHLFHPSGWFTRAKATFIRQTGHFAKGDEISFGRDNFWVFDSGIGYRFRNGQGFIGVEARNLFNSKFNFQDVDENDSTIARHRVILGRLALEF